MLIYGEIMMKKSLFYSAITLAVTLVIGKRNA